MSNNSPARRGSLYQRLVIPLSAFVLLASLGLVIWISQVYRHESMRRFERTAATNAGFMQEVRLPRSREMAERLSTILDSGVAFYAPGEPLVDSGNEGWPAELPAVLEKAARSSPTTVESGGFDLALAPLADSAFHLVLIRKRAGGLAEMGGWVLAPTVVLTAIFGCLVFLLAHRIVHPLTALTSWLPNLKHDEEPTAPIPANLSNRSDELGQLARSLEQTHHRMLNEQKLRHQSERLATLGRIATSLAHEIRNPAAAIRMHADLLARGSTPDSENSISLIRDEVERITDLVNQWLFVARAAPPERLTHNLTDLVHEVARRQQAALDHAGARLAIDAAGPVRISCDKVRMEQVIRNLIVNAIQAMPSGGLISASVTTDGALAKLRVSDQGKGFSDEALERFGEAFFSEREGGMGIGLTLAREVIQAHDGTIEASNSAEGGAVVEVALPLCTNSQADL